MKSPLVSSATIRLANITVMILASVILPRYIGPEHYGLAIAIFAIPAMIQGLFEVAVSGLPLQRFDGENPLSKLGILPPLMAIVAAGGVWALYGHRLLWIGLSAFIAFWWIMTSILMAQAHHERRHFWVAASFGAQAVALAVATALIIVFEWRVEEAYMVATAAMYLTGAYVYTLHPSGRKLMRSFTISFTELVSVARILGALAGPRAFTTVVQAGYPVMAIFFYGPQAGAQFKVAMILAFFAAQVIPVHPLVIQGEVRALTHGVSWFVLRNTAVGLVSGVVIAIVLYKVAATAIPAAYGDAYRDAAHLLQTMVVALPFLVLFQVGAAALTGIGRGGFVGAIGWVSALNALAFGLLAGTQSPEAMADAVIRVLMVATLVVWVAATWLYLSSARSRQTLEKATKGH